jgi:di/tricarboxylate transporter
MSDIYLTFAIVAIVVVLFVWNRVPVAVVALATSLALYATGILDAKQALAGLGDPVVIFLGSLFVVSAGLESAGVTTWAGQLLVRKAGASRARLLVLLMLVAALFTAMIGFVGAVAALVPVAVVAAVRFGIPTSQLMIPLAFSASAGGLLTLTASPVNVLMSSAVGYAGLREFAFFEFALAGLPLLAGTVAIILVLGGLLLPHRNGASMPADFSAHARTLVEQYRLRDGLHRLRVRASSPYVGQTRDRIDLAKYPGVRLVSYEAGDRTGKRAAIAEGDVLLVRGDAATAALLATEAHLAFRGEGDVDVSETLFNRESGLAEVVVPPRSAVIGRKVFPGMTTSTGDLIILAVQRGGEDLGAGEVTLQPGDHVLLQGTWDALDRYLADPQVLVVDSPEVVRRQALALGPGSMPAIAILGALVAMLASGQVPAAIAGSACAAAMVVARVLTVQQAYRGIDWNTVLLIGGMIPLSTAMTETGAAQLLADGLLGLVGQAGPYAVLAGLFVLTAVLGQLISNTATALIIAPIAIAAAVDLGVSPRALVMSITVAAACSFFTPVATPPNLMVMGPGGYRFGDYWKLGVPLTLWFFLIAVFWVPVVWRL